MEESSRVVKHCVAGIRVFKILANPLLKIFKLHLRDMYEGEIK